MRQKVQTQLAAIRRSRGMGASDLARRIGVSRQTIYAIEGGAYVPNTEVTLRLALELAVPVEELFSLASEGPDSEGSISSQVLSAAPPAIGQPVRVCQIGDRWISVPISASPYFLPESDGVLTQIGRADKASLTVWSKEQPYQQRLLLAGCDPATGLLAHMVEKASGVELIAAAASSKLALRWLKEGKVHIAGSHLEDPKTGEFNLPFLRQEFPDIDFVAITFANWEEGLVVGRGNPKGVRAVDDLGRKDLRFINREPGSGSRALLDRLLAKIGLDAKKVQGYDRLADGHLAAANAVFAGEADCCLATRSAAQAFGLDFVPLHNERYDFVMRKSTLEIPAAQAFLNVLQRASLRRKLELIAGYDTSQTGAVLEDGKSKSGTPVGSPRQNRLKAAVKRQNERLRRQPGG